MNNGKSGSKKGKRLSNGGIAAIAGLAIVLGLAARSQISTRLGQTKTTQRGVGTTPDALPGYTPWRTIGVSPAKGVNCGGNETLVVWECTEILEVKKTEPTKSLFAFRGRARTS